MKQYGKLSNISAMQTNINGLNPNIKRKLILEWITKKKNPLYYKQDQSVK